MRLHVKTWWFLDVWADDAAFMKQQPGFISTQLHRGTAGSTTFVNVAVWESARALGEAFRSPEFQRRSAQYPEEAIAAPHVFKRSRLPESAWPDGSAREIDRNGM